MSEMLHDSIPSVDLADFCSDSPERKSKFVQELGEAYQSIGFVAVRNHFLSLDPYMRGRMNDSKSYAASQPLNEVMIGGTVGEVVDSKNSHFAVGDKVVGMGGWQEYVTVDATQRGVLSKVDTTHIPLSAYLGARDEIHAAQTAMPTGPVTHGRLAGDLVIVGGGDPSLTAEHWWRFARQIRATGIQSIEGDIVIDRTMYQSQAEDPDEFDGKGYRTYNVLPDALLVNLQSAEFYVRAEGGDALALGSTQCLDLQVRSSRQRKRHTARRVGT